MNHEMIRKGLLSMALAASSGAYFVSSGQTLPPAQDVKAAFDSIVKSDHFGEPQALPMMKEFIERFPASSYVPEVELIMADRYFYDGLYPLAFSTYSRLSPSMFAGETRKRYLYRYAFSMIKTGYYKEARPLMTALLYEKGYGNAAQFYLAYVAYVEGDYDKAFDGFKKVSPTSERGLEAEYYLNQIEYRRGNYSKVTATSARLLQGDVDFQLRPETMKVAGISHYKLGDSAKARPLLEEYVSLKGDGAEATAVYTLGAILFDGGEYDRAEKLFSSLVDDNNALAQSSWLYLGQIHAIRGDDQAAVLAFDRAAKSSWDPAVTETAAFNLAVASATGGRVPFADSVSRMENFIADYPGSPYSDILSRYLANAYYNQHQYAKALAALDKLGAKDRETSELRQKINYRYGMEQIRGGEYAGAIKSLRNATEGPDKNVGAQASLWLGDAFYGSGQYADAAKAYTMAAGSDYIGDNRGLAYYDLGYAQMKLKKYPAALTAFNNALKGDNLSASQRADAELRKADCLYYTGRYDEAMTEFRRLAARKDANGVYASIRQADILGREGKIDEKIRILNEIAESGNTGVWTSTVLQRLGDAYSEKGDDAKAAVVYARIIDSSGSEDGMADRSGVYYSLAANADRLYNAGNVMEALEIYKKLEESGLPEIYSQGVIGMLRSSDNPVEIAEYADKTMRLPGITPDITAEARYLKAAAQLDMGAVAAAEGEATLRDMASDPDSDWGAEASLELGRYYLEQGKPSEAETVLLRLIDSNCSDSDLLARGYILLSDACVSLDKDYLAKLYLETLRANYPGNDKAIYEMIDTRLKKLK